ncbi:hypothetical protein SteCoe_32703 [Stentor coeruleus]|uniref:PAP-associated domain-containing protein n=1 Tax=Stentor coeruleus TaxID=5963 RepID=A0A1R2AYD1_9CILI|nr:hypothetical protein SteCoe_32703 [Stentor coeruleus]
MDLAYADYIKDSNQYLRNFASKKYCVTDHSIGLILACNQKDINNELALLQSLEIAFSALKKLELINLCYLKFFKSSEYFLNRYPDLNLDFLQIYIRVCLNLPHSSSLSNVSEIFCCCFNKLIGIYARSIDLVKIIHIGRKNACMFKEKPKILSDEIFRDIEKLSRIKDEENFPEIMLTIFGVCRQLNFSRGEGIEDLGLYLETIIKIVYDEKLTLQYFEEFSSKIQGFIRLFSEGTRIELEMYEQMAASKLGYAKGQVYSASSSYVVSSNAIPRKSAEYFENSSKEKKYSKEPSNYAYNNYEKEREFHQNIDIMHPKKNQESALPEIKSEEPSYIENHPLEFSMPRDRSRAVPMHSRQILGARASKNLKKIPVNNYEIASKDSSEEAPPEIILNNSSPFEIIQDTIRYLESQWAENNSFNDKELKDIFSEFYNQTVEFQVELAKCLKSSINEYKIDSRNLEFWRIIIQTADEFIKIDQKKELENLLDKKMQFKNHSSSRRNGQFRKRPSQRSRIATGTEHKDLTDPGYNSSDEPPEFQPLGSYVENFSKENHLPEKSYAVNDAFSSFNPDSLLNNCDSVDEQNKQWVKDPNNISEIIEKKIESASNPINKLYSSEIKVNLIEKNEVIEQQYPKTGGKIEEDIYQISIENAIENLTNDVLKLIAKHKGEYDDIIEINELLSLIRSKFKEKSPSATLKLIGSALIGTYIKNSDFDILLIDYLSPDPAKLLVQSLNNLGMGNTQLNNFFLITPPNKNFRLKIQINDEMVYELSSLIKEYCKLDSRCIELIILIKLWAQKNGLQGQGMPSGIHLSLLVILFLQTCTPQIFPSLQCYEHNPKYINGNDVWFLTGSDFESCNTQSLGDLIMSFFEFLTKFSEKSCVGNIRQACIYENTETNYFFSMFHPFTNHEFSSIQKNSPESEQFLHLLKYSACMLLSREKLSKIMPS